MGPMYAGIPYQAVPGANPLVDHPQAMTPSIEQRGRAFYGQSVLIVDPPYSISTSNYSHGFPMTAYDTDSTSSLMNNLYEGNSNVFQSTSKTASESQIK